MRFGKTVSFYSIRAVVPYFALSWLVLTVILFVQQAGRYADIFFDPNLPASFVWQLTFALIPNVIAFTCPMAVLVGVIIGLSRMQADNELVAIRNIGIGNIAAAGPVFVLGIFLSLFSIAVNIFGVPAASRAVRSVAMRSALYKLESPIEPGVFNTEIAGFTVYVRGADFETGRWANVFVYNEDPSTGKSRLITSRRGRIDSNDQRSELVLENAVVSTVDDSTSDGDLVSENFGELRLAIKTRRDEMVSKLSVVSQAVEELGLVELARFAADQEGKEAAEAKIIIVRRIVLAFAPVLFSLLGAAMVLGIAPRGRGYGILLSLAILLAYFLLTFAGEQLARSGVLPVIFGGLLAPAATLIAIAFFAYKGNKLEGKSFADPVLKKLKDLLKSFSLRRQKDVFVDLTTGIRDLDLVLSLLRFYLFSIGFLSAVFLVFTAFELWRHAGSFSGGPTALLKYLIYLFPFTYLQIGHTAAMISILTVYTIKSRQNEIVIWLSAGQSLYRLLLPCLLLMLFLGGLHFVVQEIVSPITNRRQEDLRKFIRNRGVMPKTDGRFWVATDQTITSFKDGTSASDNDQRTITNCSQHCAVEDVTVYQFEADKAELQALYHISKGNWDSGTLNIVDGGYSYKISPVGAVRSELHQGSISLPRSAFSGSTLRINQLSLSEMSTRIDDADSNVERQVFSVAIQKRYSTLFLPFVIGLFTAPFAIGIGRKGRIVSIALGVALWLGFVAIISAFDQLGLVGTLPASVAVWAPLLAFSMIGIYLISRVRT
jgi:lipopolysaccharide export LptBFGC system permease protein LptF